ncbi:thioredoxin 1 [Oxalobacteraceae bacterium GrIS 2.11]
MTAPCGSGLSGCQATQCDTMKKILVLLICILSLNQFCLAGDLPYDESANSAADIQAALLKAQAEKKEVLLIFGANWCKDCVELDRSLKGQSAALINKKFVLVKVNVGQFDTNLNIANEYGNPIKKGIPAAVLLTSKNAVLYATHGGELADARTMGDQGIYDFFSGIEQHKQN